MAKTKWFGNCTQIYEKAMMAAEKGVSLNYCEYKDMVYVWMLLNFRESRQARREIAELILKADRNGTLPVSLNKLAYPLHFYRTRIFQRW